MFDHKKKEQQHPKYLIYFPNKLFKKVIKKRKKRKKKFDVERS